MENTNNDEIIRFKTEAEKAREIKYNSDGERLVYVGNDCWLPEKAVPTEQDIREYYARFARPRIYPLAILWNMLIPLVLASGILCFCKFYLEVEWFLSQGNCVFSFLIFIGAYVLLHLKQLLIFAIRLYQRFAPQHIRERCVFTPTCSDYAIISLNKYGLIIGSIRAIQRLRRCNYDHGGYDFP